MIADAVEITDMRRLPWPPSPRRDNPIVLFIGHGQLGRTVLAGCADQIRDLAASSPTVRVYILLGDIDQPRPSTDVARIADRVSFLHNGQLQSTGTFDDIASNPVVRQAYLGTHADEH